MIVMRAAMDSAALKAGGLAHHKAIGSSDGKGVTFLGNYAAVNAASATWLRPQGRPDLGRVQRLGRDQSRR
jgi:hypothetical protein